MEKKILLNVNDEFLEALQVLNIYWNYKSTTRENLIKEIIIDFGKSLADVRNIDLKEVYFITTSKWDMIE